MTPLTHVPSRDIKMLPQDYRVALLNAGVGIFLSLPESLRDTCPLFESAAQLLNEPEPAKLSTGGVAGVVVAAVVAVALAVVAIVLAVRYRRLRTDYEKLTTSKSPGV
jgi:hypothetical protein